MVDSAGDGSLIALIADQDTATGMLLTGIGHVDYRKNTNYLIVDDSALLESWWRLYGWSCVFFPSSTLRRPPPAETTQQQIEDAFREYTSRDDVAVVLINQSVSAARKGTD